MMGPVGCGPTVPGRCAVPAGNHRTGCSLVLQRPEHVESRRSAGGEDGGPDSGHHREHEKGNGRSHLFHRADPDTNWPAWYAAYMVAEQAGTDLPS